MFSVKHTKFAKLFGVIAPLSSDSDSDVIREGQKKKKKEEI